MSSLCIKFNVEGGVYVVLMHKCGVRGIMSSLCINVEEGVYVVLVHTSGVRGVCRLGAGRVYVVLVRTEGCMSSWCIHVGEGCMSSWCMHEGGGVYVVLAHT